MASKKVEVIIIGKDELSKMLSSAEKKLVDFEGAAKKAGDSTEAFSTKTIAAGTFLGNIYEKAACKVTNAIRDMANQAFEAASAWEEQQIALGRLVGDQEMARVELEKWNTMAIKSPIDPKDWRDAGIQLKALGFELNQIPGILTAAGDAAIVFKGKMNLSQITEAFGQIKTGNFNQAFEQFRKIGIAIKDLKGEGLEFDRSGAYIGSVDEALKAVQKIVEERFGGMMEEQAKSGKNLINTIQENWEQLLKTMMDSGPYDYIKERLKDINNILIEVNENISGKFYERTKTQYDQLRSSLTDLEKRYQEFIKLGGEKKAWLNFGLPDLEKISEEMEKIRNIHPVIGREDIRIDIEKYKELATEKYGGASMEWYAKLNQAIKENTILKQANTIVSKENREAIAPMASLLQKEEAARKAAEKAAAEALKSQIQANEDLKRTIDEFSKYELKNLEKEYENLRKVQEQVNSGALKLSGEGLKNLKTRLTDVGIELGKYNFLLEDSDMEGFVDDLGKAQESMNETIQSFKAMASLLPGLQGIWNWGESPEAEETFNTAQKIGQELQKWSDGLAEFLDMMGLVGSGLDRAAEGISQLGAGLQEAFSEDGDIFAGLTNILGGASKIAGEEGSDISKLISGASNVGVGVARAISGDLTGIIQALAGLPDLFDGLTESFNESFNKQWEAQGFDDQLSEGLIDAIGEVSDAMGGKEFGMRAYIEDIFKEVDISNAEEFTRLSDLLNESMGDLLAQGVSVEEIYERYGDELKELKEAQEKYGFESTASLDQMVKLYREQTAEGRAEGITEAIGGAQKMIDAMSEYGGYSGGAFTSVFGLVQNLFEKLRAEGLSTQDIFEKISPLVESAKKAAEAAGVSTAPMDDLLKFYQMMEDSAPLFDIISGIDTALQGLSDTGTLTQANLEALAQTTLETYKNMQAEGFSPEQIAAAMGPGILEMAEAAEKFGFTLPKEMMDLISIMKEEGIETVKTDAEILQEWGDEFINIQKTWGDQMIKTLENLGGYQEGGLVSGGKPKQLAWLHKGEIVLPPGINPINSAVQQPPVFNINISENPGGLTLRERIIVTVQEEAKHGRIQIPESSVI